ncbi:hypothetical protein X735_19370 [Mesorhizobium sp. L2C085B000]|nr:hypothetical protein X735_19370 [Mesorhizobium sp. L2C085B000]
MAWIKVVQRIGFIVCPKCENRGFELQPGEDIDNASAKIRCGRCGYVCSADE